LLCALVEELWPKYCSVVQHSHISYYQIRYIATHGVHMATACIVEYAEAWLAGL